MSKDCAENAQVVSPSVTETDYGLRVDRIGKPESWCQVPQSCPDIPLPIDVAVPCNPDFAGVEVQPTALAFAGD